MISIKSHSGIFTLETTQQLPISALAAWDFFSSHMNLAKITPPNMGFDVTSNNSEKIYAGQIITYKIEVLPHVRMNWVTEITHVNKPFYFVDEQRFGPYAMWHHEHFFEENTEGVLMTDRVSYKIPFGPLGQLMTSGMIKKQLLKIFTFRNKTLEAMFPASK